MKKIVSAVLASFFIFSGVSANPIKTNAITEKNIRLVGDINVDGKIDAVDASGILTTYAKLSVEGGDMKDMNLECISNRYVADVNNDGRIDGVDASLVLTKYAASSVGKDVEYEVLVIAKENIQIGYDSQDVLRFIGDSWNVHTTPELGSHNIYQKKKKLSKNDIVYVLSQTSDYWYYAIVDGSETAVFVRVLPEEMNNFEKIGKLSDYTANLLVTTKPITTKLTTTTTTTTTATSSSTRITTTGSTTSQITTNSNQTNKVFSVNDEVIFTEKSWSLYHTREVKDEPDDFLYRNQKFIVKEAFPYNWYAILVKGSSEVMYLRINPKYEYAFNKVDDTSESVTTTKVTTTKATTATTATTTVAKPTTSITTSITTTVNVPTPVEDNPTYSNWQRVRFLSKTPWEVRSSNTVAEDNVVNHLNYLNYFWIKSYKGNGWYEVMFRNEKDSYFINIPKEREPLFEPVDNTDSFKFIGDNVLYIRAYCEFDDNNIIGALENGDIIQIKGDAGVTDWLFISYYDGTKIASGYVYTKLFEKIS